LGLSFSRHSLDFLIWVTAHDAGKRGEAWSFKGSLELGDRLLLVAAYNAVHGSDIARRWAERHPWRSEVLCRLLHATDFHSPFGPAGDFSPWLAPAGVAVLEAWQQRLADRWVVMDQEKSRAATVQELRAAAQSQTQTLEAYLHAIDQACRRDLARFLLMAGGRLFQTNLSSTAWLNNAVVRCLRLADRQQAQRDARVVARQFECLAAWQAQARGVGFLDEGYAAAQLWKSQWEAYNGDGLAAAARRLLDQIQWS
jgi:hypothetical protein